MDLKKWFGVKRLFHYQNEVRQYFKHSGSADPGYALNNSDLCIYVPTGYGKTLAHAIPVYDYFTSTDVAPLKKSPTGCHVLVVVPNLELGCQTREVFKTMFQDIPEIKIGILDRNPLLSRGTHILIASAIQLVDLAPPSCDRCPIDFFPLRFVVVDEADRLLDIENIGPWLFALQHITRKKDLERGALLQRPISLAYESIYPQLPDNVDLPDYHDGGPPPEDHDETSQVQGEGRASVRFNKIILTATNVADFKGYRMLRLYRPISINGLLDSKSESKLTQYLATVGTELTVESIFASVICKGCRTLAFCRDGNRAISLASKLSRDHPEVSIRPISNGTTASRRLKTLEAFRNGNIDVLVCSDLASRGLHIEGVKTVIHSDCPRSEEIYIHRIGRTARAGESGQSILIATPSRIHTAQAVVQAANKYRPCELRTFLPQKLCSN